jgi:hypothetical protein
VCGRGTAVVLAGADRVERGTGVCGECHAGVCDAAVDVCYLGGRLGRSVEVFVFRGRLDDGNLGSDRAVYYIYDCDVNSQGYLDISR